VLRAFPPLPAVTESGSPLTVARPSRILHRVPDARTLLAIVGVKPARSWNSRDSGLFVTLEAGEISKVLQPPGSALIHNELVATDEVREHSPDCHVARRAAQRSSAVIVAVFDAARTKPRTRKSLCDAAHELTVRARVALLRARSGLPTAFVTGLDLPTSGARRARRRSLWRAR